MLYDIKKSYLYIALFIIIGIVLLPLFFGIIFVVLASVGITPTWNNTSFDTSFEILKNTIIQKQIIFSFVRANIIGVILLFVSFFLGYLLSSNYSKKTTKIYLSFLSVPHMSLAMGFFS